MKFVIYNYDKTFSSTYINQHYIIFQARTFLLPILEDLSWAHEYDDRFEMNDQLWSLTKENLQVRWTFPAAVCYALTVITTTG